MAEKELEKKGTTEVSLFDSITTTGFEDTSQETVKMPMMKAISKSSNEVDKDNPKYDPKAEIGKFFNTATGEVFEELNVIVLKVSHELFVWDAIKLGALKGIHPLSERKSLVASKDGYQEFDIDGNKIKDTITFIMMNVNDPTDIFAHSVNSTAFKYGINFNTRLRSLKRDGRPTKGSFEGVWNIKTKMTSKDGNNWYNIGNTPKFERFVTAEEAEFIIPALDMLKTAEVDHGVAKEDTETVNTPY